MHKRAKGNIGENIACEFLVKNGFEIVARNYQKKWGELDIVAVKDKVISFFEVKSVTADLSMFTDAHKPEENVHSFKVRQIRRMIKTYYAEYGMISDQEFNFHVLCVYMDMKTRRAKVKWLRDVIL